MSTRASHSVASTLSVPAKLWHENKDYQPAAQVYHSSPKSQLGRALLDVYRTPKSNLTTQIIVAEIQHPEPDQVPESFRDGT